MNKKFYGYKVGNIFFAAAVFVLVVLLAFSLMLSYQLKLLSAELSELRETLQFKKDLITERLEWLERLDSIKTQITELYEEAGFEVEEK